MKYQIGIVGLALGIFAVGMAIFQNDLRSPKPAPEPEPEPTFKELAVEAGRKVIQEKILKKEERSPAKNGAEVAEESVRDGIELTYMILGFVAMVLGVLSWTQKDHIRISGGAVALGLMAVAWQYVLIGVVIAVIILVLANVSA
ncbi:MAG: hypothetical protein ACON5H_03155 [Akkermansiaceae bacterium]